MIRKFATGLLIFCFGLSSANVVLATEVVAAGPIIVQPPDLQAVNQQMVAYDRENQDQESVIKGLIDQNQRLTNTAMAQQQDAALEKIFANDRKVSPRYRDLVNLTENVDEVKGVGQTLELRRDVIEEKYKILNDLKDEMTALNDKLSTQAASQNFEEMNHQQVDRIQALTQKLEDMNQRIAQYDLALAQKDRQIVQLENNLATLQNQAAIQGEIIKEQKNQIEILQENTKGHSVISTNNVALPAIPSNIVSSSNNHQPSPLIAGQVPPIAGQAASGELARLQGMVYSQEEIIKQQADQIAILKSQTTNVPLSQAGNNMSLPPIIVNASNAGNTANTASGEREAKLIDSIRWLNQVLAVTKSKAEYYQLTAQQEQMNVRQYQGEVQNIKDDFARRMQEYSQFEGAFASLKNQLQDKDDQIVKMRTDIQGILQAQANKEIFKHHIDDRVQLARELIGLQEQEASLLNEKSDIEAQYNTIFERHAIEIENKIKSLLVTHQIQTTIVQNHIEELKSELAQKDEQIAAVNKELENKIADEKNQSVLVDQIQDLKAQIQDKDNQITSMKAEVQSGQDTQAQADTLRQQVRAEQDKENLLKQQLDSKTAESNRMTLVLQDYQKKLEFKDSAYNEQLSEVLSLKKYRAQVEKKIADLSLELQTKDLNLSMEQQKAADEKINEYQEKIDGLQATNVSQLEVVKNLKTELALAREQLVGMPSNDEIEFLRAGLKKATLQLKQRDVAFVEIKANAEEYAKTFKEQTRGFQSLKDQLLNAQQELGRRDEDLKYKDLAITRLKVISKTREKSFQGSIAALKNDLDQEKSQLDLLKDELSNKVSQGTNQGGLEAQIQGLKDKLRDAQDQIDRKSEDLKYKDMAIARLKERAPVNNKGDLQVQVAVLTQKLDADEKKLQGKPHDKAEVLQEQLEIANEQIRGLRKQLDQFESFYRVDPAGAKLKQALTKIDEQGRMINALVQKLQDAGQSADVTKNAGKS